MKLEKWNKSRNYEKMKLEKVDYEKMKLEKVDYENETWKVK